MKNNTVGQKIWIIVIFGLMSLSFVSGLSIYTMNVLSHKTTELYKHPFHVSKAALEIKVGVLDIHRTMKDISTAKSEKEINERSKIVDDHEQNILSQFTVLEERFLGDLEQVMMTKKLFIDWKVIRDEVIALSLKGESDQAKGITKGKGAAHIKKLENQIDAFLDFAYGKGKSFYEGSMTFKKQKINLFMIITGLVAICLVFFSIMIVQKLNKDLKITGKSLKDQSGKVGGTVSKLFSVGEKLVRSANEQSSLLSSAVEAVVELEQSANSSSNQATKAANIVNENQSVTRKSAGLVDELTMAINNIEKANSEVISSVQQSHKDIGGIVEMIQEISVKTQIINEIVFQTKLLSFNASVEAARAGEHGKGFAVVAEEVGNLASLSGQAASEINTMLDTRTEEISQLVAKSTSTIEAKTNTARDKIQSGLKIVQECKENFNHLTNNSGKINQMIKDVDQTSLEQVDAIKLVLEDIDRLNRLGIENRETSRETHSMSESLVSGQENLDAIVIDLRKLIDKNIA